MWIGHGTEADLGPIVEILNGVAATSIASFDTHPTNVAERRAWFEQFAEAGLYQLLVARRDNTVIGYAASQRYRDHDAFRETVEISVALHAGYRSQGVGSALYKALFDRLAGEPVHVAVAGIAMPNDASVAPHRNFGFTEVGTFSRVRCQERRVHQFALDAAPRTIRWYSRSTRPPVATPWSRRAVLGQEHSHQARAKPGRVGGKPSRCSTDSHRPYPHARPTIGPNRSSSISSRTARTRSPTRELRPALSGR